MRNEYHSRRKILQYPSASAKTVDSGAFGETICWEVDDAGILKIFGSGEILDWNWVNDPRIYGHCRIRSVVIGRGIRKLGYVDYSPYRLEKITILDPECLICESSSNSDPTESSAISNVRFTGCIYGFSGSYAQTYAEKHKFTFKEIKASGSTVTGDINGDGVFTVSDLVILQKWLLNVPGTQLMDWKAADLCEDDKLDAFDMCLMRKALVEQN